MRVTSQRIPLKAGRARFGLVRARAGRWPAPIVWCRPSCASDADQRDEREPAKQEVDDDDRARAVALAGEGDDHRDEVEDGAALQERTPPRQLLRATSMGWVEIGRDQNVGLGDKRSRGGVTTRLPAAISRTHDRRTVGIDFFVRKGGCVMGGMSTCKGFLDSERARSWAAAPDRTGSPKAR